MALPDRHLDLGCGARPRNPYQRSQLCGVDIRPLGSTPGFEYRTANLSLEPIPYGDAEFGSVSAFDFIEHIPRILPAADLRGTRFPFIQLMNEVWRVLAPGGRFYALTPAYPHVEAFTDPTHVNIITASTHEYFCGDAPLGAMYGFTGSFRPLAVRWTLRGDAYSAIRGATENYSPGKRLARKVRAISRTLRGKQATLRPPYLLWELEANKPGRTP